MSAPTTAITQANSLNPAQPIGSYWTDTSRTCVCQHLDKPQSPSTLAYASAPLPRYTQPGSSRLAVRAS